MIEVEPYWLEVLGVSPEELKGEWSGSVKFESRLTEDCMADATDDMLAIYENAVDPFVQAEAGMVSFTQR